MFLKRIDIKKYRGLENLEINLEKNPESTVYSLASINGGGKSTLLQFIFTMLHCFMDDEKKVFIRNLLGQPETKSSELVEFTVEHEGKEYDLEFIIYPAENEWNFNLFLDVKNIEEKLREGKDKKRDYEDLVKMNEYLRKNNRVDPIFKSQIESKKYLFKDPDVFSLYEEAIKANTFGLYANLINYRLEKFTKDIKEIIDYESIYAQTKNELNSLLDELEKRYLHYVTHLQDNKTVLLLKTTMPSDLLTELSNKIYLTAHSSQVFHFLKEEEKQKIFNSFIDINDELKRILQERFPDNTSYEKVIVRTKLQIDGFFTFDIASTEFILESFKKAFHEDRKTKLRTNEYGDHYDKLVAELENFLDNIRISVDEDFSKVIIRLKDTGQELSPADLSHGELKRLSIYLWLKNLIEKDSIILMDEVDIALHPGWQFEVVKDLAKWSGNCQFFLATHSPQILSSTHFKNIIKLKKRDQESSRNRMTSPQLIEI